MKIHFISGLPRSGSTLLAAILSQNPRFRATVTSPVSSLFGALIPKMSGGSEFVSFFSDEKRASILRNVMECYHSASPDRIVFDTNRTWTGRIALLKSLYPESRIICCVRDIGSIIDSIERVLRKNPLQYSRTFNFKSGASVYARADVLMDSDNGLVGSAWSTLREAWFSDNAASLIVLPYEVLTHAPAQAIESIYSALGEEPFCHDFDNVMYTNPHYDADLGMPGMHTVERKVRAQTPAPTIPPDLIAKYADASFWQRAGFNHKGVKIINGK